MKTQLLEDICESTTLTLVPSKAVPSKPAARSETMSPGLAALPNQRTVSSVWRQKSSDKQLLAPALPDAQPSPLELESVFEEIAALEAQYVAPEPRHVDTPASNAPLHEPAGLPDMPLDEAAVAPVPLTQVGTLRNEPVLASGAVASPASLQDPLFDFLPPTSPQRDVSNPFSASIDGAGPRHRYMIWAACIVAAALLLQGGWWLSQEPEAANGKTANAIANSSAFAANDDVRPPGKVSAEPVVTTPQAKSASTIVPPLVLLEPAPAKELATAPAQSAPSVVTSTATPETVIAPARPAAVSAQPARRIARKQAPAVAEVAAPPAERESERQASRESRAPTPRIPTRESAMAATLKACKEHGYQADQCVKRACSVTKYGFVCRGS